MASLAGLLKAAGARVSGSDNPLYPPMSTLLEKLEISVLTGFDPAHFEGLDPDRVVIGNAVPRTNVEVEEVLRRGLPYTSMPEALREYFLDGRHPVVVAGTHGKTTTSLSSPGCSSRQGFIRPSSSEVNCKTSARISSSAAGSISSSRGMSTTPPSSTRGRSSSITPPGRSS